MNIIQKKHWGALFFVGAIGMPVYAIDCSDTHSIIATNRLEFKNSLTVVEGNIYAKDADVETPAKVTGNTDILNGIYMHSANAFCGKIRARTLTTDNGGGIGTGDYCDIPSGASVVDNAFLSQYKLKGNFEVGGMLSIANPNELEGRFTYKTLDPAQNGTFVGGVVVQSNSVNVPNIPACTFPFPSVSPAVWVGGRVLSPLVNSSSYDFPDNHYQDFEALAGSADRPNQLTFNAGDYYFDNLILQENTHITINGKVNIYVQGGFRLNNDSKIILDNPADLHIYVFGKPDLMRTGAVDRSVFLGVNVDFVGHLWAKQEALSNPAITDIFEVKNSSSLIGSFYAVNLLIDTSFKLIGRPGGSNPQSPVPTTPGTSNPSSNPTLRPSPTATPCPVYQDLGAQPLLQSNRLPNRNTIVDSKNKKIFFTGYETDTRIDTHLSGQLKAVDYTFDDQYQLQLTNSWDAASTITSANLNQSEFLTGNAEAEIEKILMVSQLDPVNQLQPIQDVLNQVFNRPPAVEDILDYVKGNQSRDGKAGFADRGGELLGTIVHSEPNLLGPSRQLIRDLPNDTRPSHLDFYNSTQDRRNYLVIGANDGFLRFIDAQTGKVVVSYSADAMLPKLVRLASDDDQHEFFFDGKITIADYYSNKANQWNTATLATCGYGAPCVVALNTKYDQALITNNNARDFLLWEFSNEDIADDSPLRMGYTIGQPIIARIKEQEHYRWVAIFANGYRNEGALKAGIFIVDMDDKTKVRTMVVPGSEYLNGLPAINTLDYEGDGLVDYAYGCDVLGNCWQFNLADVFSTANPKITNVFKTHNNRPVFNQPQLRINEDNLNISLLFGTGKFDSPEDQTSSNQEYFYSVVVDPKNPPAAPITPTTMQSIVKDRAESAAMQGSTFNLRTVKKGPVVTNSQGWYFALPDARERVVTDALVLSDFVYFSSIIPSTTMCHAPMTGWFNIFDPETGLQPANYIDTNGDGVFDAQDKSPAGMSISGMTLSMPSIIPNPQNNQVANIVLDVSAPNSPAGETTKTPPQQFRLLKKRTSWQQVQ